VFLQELLTFKERQTIIASAQSENGICNYETKLFEKVYELKTGQPVDASRGLSDRMNIDSDSRFYLRVSKQVKGIQEEIDEFASESSDLGTSEERKEVKNLLEYILNEEASEKEYPNGTRDLGRQPVTLSWFLTHRKAQESRLSAAEVVALRLYTTSAFKFMNTPLRDDGRYKKGKVCPLAVTTHFADSGIKKLRALHSDSEPESIVLWRGMRNSEPANEFMTKGGTELGFMSTTSNIKVAVKYSLSHCSLLFKIKPASFMTMGADLQWVSAFPQESEILYPPLTYLKPTGKTQKMSVELDDKILHFTVIEVQPYL
jgi:hypothetical protein